jgi:hypothetical protein
MLLYLRVDQVHKDSGCIASIRQLVQLIHGNLMRHNLILLIDTIFLKIIFKYHEFCVGPIWQCDVKVHDA